LKKNEETKGKVEEKEREPSTSRALGPKAFERKKENQRKTKPPKYRKPRINLSASRPAN